MYPIFIARHCKGSISYTKESQEGDNHPVKTHKLTITERNTAKIFILNINW